MSDVWGVDGKVSRMWAIPVYPNGEMGPAQHSTSAHEAITDFTGIYGFGDVVTVHLWGTLPDVYERASERAKEYREMPA